MSHQTYSHAGRTYVSPFTRADVDDEGTLRFAWWEGNERLKGAEVAVAADPHAPCYFQTATNVSVGAVLEATVTLPPAAAASWLEWPGCAAGSLQPTLRDRPASRPMPSSLLSVWRPLPPAGL